MGSLLNKANKKTILPGSIVTSIVLHLLSLAFLQRQSIWFSSPPVKSAPSESWISSIEKNQKDEILKEAFTSYSYSRATKTVLPQEEEEAPLVFQVQSLHLLEKKNETAPSSIKKELPFFRDSMLPEPPSIAFSLPTKEKLDLFEHLPKDLILPLSSQPFLREPQLIPEILAVNLSLPQPPISGIQEKIPPLFSPEKKPFIIPSSAIEKELAAQVLSFAMPRPLPKLPSLAEMKSVSYSEDFETELVFLPIEGEGYLFALTLIPRTDLHLPPLKQNYFFLIDRSNSVQKERLQAAKAAVNKALEELGESDTFNIIAFDSKIDKLFTTPLPVNRESIQRAKVFLESIELGSFFSQTDLIKPLFLTVPASIEKDELYTAILLTDGEAFGKKGISRTLLNDWTRYNDGKVSLFTLSIGGDAHAAILDAASAFNKGKFSSSPSKRGLKRKLLKIMKTVGDPLAKNISCKAIMRTPSTSIEIYPRSNQMPHLYLNEPYVIVGKIATLDDFILFVQGQIKGEWFHIKKTISFLNAKKGHATLKTEFALQKAYDLYDRYLIDNQSAHITEARSLLESYNLQAAFE